MRVEPLNEQSSSWLRFRSELFSIRLWHEGRADGDGRWRGRLHHVASGEQREFWDWETFIAGLFELTGQCQGAAR
jgi:hypothetical protein